jgi:hypothetical protein
VAWVELTFRTDGLTDRRSRRARLTPERARGDVENPIPGIVSELDARFVVAEQRAWRNTDARADAARAGQRSVPISSPHFMAAIQAVHPVRRVSATLSVTLSVTLSDTLCSDRVF